jgi:phage terminase small subunit
MGGPGSGRRPRPVKEHILAGTFRKDRHGPDLASVDDLGEPTRPQGLSPAARALWDLVARCFSGREVLTELDAAELRAGCEVWSLYRGALKVAQKDPTNARACKAVVAYLARFEAFAKRFGLNPVDRARIRVAEKAKPTVTTRRRA